LGAASSRAEPRLTHRTGSPHLAVVATLYTPPVPSEQIARNLSFVNWTVLVGLAVGAFAAVVLLRLRSDAPKGYLGFTAFCAACFAGLAWLSDGALPAGTAAGSPIAVDAAWDLPRRFALAVFGVGALVSWVAIARGHRAIPLLLVTLVAGAATLVCGALTWGGGPLTTVALVLQMLALAAATGGVFAGMILGHWYLVTPKLPTAPALTLTRVLLGVVVAQLVLFGAWVVAAGLAPLTGSWALFVWLRLVIGLVFPLVVTWAALQTIRTRSMESATGLLYIDVGAVAAGTVLAAGLYFGAGILV
jgi:hypothetical protein